MNKMAPGGGTTGSGGWAERQGFRGDYQFIVLLLPLALDIPFLLFSPPNSCRPSP